MISFIKNAISMTHVAQLQYNGFQENTYVIYDASKECIIIDPGCYSASEKKDIVQLIENMGLKPVRLINTHCHLDHVFGNAHIAKTFNLDLEIHKEEVPVLNAVGTVSQMYGFGEYEKSPEPTKFLAEGDFIKFGNTQLKCLFTPGHSPGSLSFYCEASNFVIAGDALFYGSIGRTDLPGGNHDTLIKSIKSELMTLPDETIVYSGHGQKTRIDFERDHNPFLR